MRNIFILYMPPANAEAMVHYEDTIHNKVPLDRIMPHVSGDVGRKLKQVFGERRIAVWGSRDSGANRAKFDRMLEGDEILIVEGATIKLLGRVACKVVSPALSRELWMNLRGGGGAGWDLIYFIANPREIGLPFAEFCRLFGYEENYQLRGFTAIASERLGSFYKRYDDLYSILLRLKAGKEIEQVVEPAVLREEPSLAPAQGEAEAEDAPASPPDKELSDHIRMQWMLLRMGRQAGEKVWAPRGDQSRISAGFNFRDFEDTFAAGLDTQVKYVENIDVVWKEEFRIDAAFEIENSTAIYSGLLRLADLSMVAPNTVYPLFIVAPGERRNRVREQLTRPSFAHLRLGKKVRYLSYEKVAEVDEFFGEEGPGLTVDVLVGKSEQLVA